MRFELVFFDLSFVWSLVSTTTSSILKRYRYESHATLQTLQRIFSTGKLVDAVKVQIYILSRKVMMILPLCTRVVRQSPIFFLYTSYISQTVEDLGSAPHHHSLHVHRPMILIFIKTSFSAKSVEQITGPRFKTRGLSNFNFCQEGNTNRFGELNFHLPCNEKSM